MPTMLSGCTLWLHAACGVTNVSGKCSQWNDLSGGGRNVTQGNSALRPTIASGINSKPTLSFDAATTNHLDNASALSTIVSASAWTVFVVYRYTGTVTTQTTSYANAAILRDTGSFWGLFSSTTAAVMYNWGSADKSVRPAASTATNYYATCSLSGGTLSAQLNQNSATTLGGVGNITTLTGTIVIGNGVSNAWGGHIGEIIVYNTALSAGNIATVQAYLAAYWGI